MRIFFLFLFLLFLFCSAQVYAIEIDSIKIGWGDGGYYRIGYFTPAQIRLKSDTDFTGTITIKIDNLSYSKNLKITKDSNETIRFDILILSSKPHIEIIAGKLPPYISNKLSIQNISPDEFLIAVEGQYLSIFQEEFTRRYPDASKKSKFASFQIDELSDKALSYDSLDLLVLSNANLSPAIQNALYGWSKDMDGIVLFKLGDIGNLSQLFKGSKKARVDNPCLNPEVYKTLPQKLIPEPVKKILSNYVLIYAIITFIVLSLLLWLTQAKKIILAIVIAIVVAIVLLYVFYLPFRSIIFEKIIFDNNTDRYNLISTEDILQNGQSVFIGVTDYSSKKQWITLPGQGVSHIKPIYKDTESISQTKIDFRFLEDKTQVKTDALKNTLSKIFIFQIY